MGGATVKMKVLVVDDEWTMRNLIKMNLSDQFEVFESNNGFEALTMLEETRPNIVILDIMMPEMNGWEVCENIRKVDQVPILMLTARNDLKDRIYGLEIGADDYLSKPFEPEELIARVHALIRRSVINEELISENEVTKIGEMVIDHQPREVYVNNTLVELTPKEFNLIELLALNPKRVFSRDLLLDKVWGINDIREARTVDSHIKNIREKFRKKIYPLIQLRLFGELVIGLISQWKLMKRPSIVIKLGIAMLLLMLVVLLPLGFAVDQIFTKFYFTHVREGIAQQSEKYSNSLDSLADPMMLNMFETLAEYTNTHILIVDKTGLVIVNSGIKEFPKETIIHNKEWLNFRTGQEVSTEYFDPNANVHFLLEGRPIYASTKVIGGMFVLSSVSDIHRSINKIRFALVLTIFISILLALCFIYFLSYRLSKPLIEMGAATRKIARGHLETRVPIYSNDEVGSLSAAINDLAIELKEYRANRREFFANVSHELRTPITYLEGYANILKKKKFKNEEEENNCIDVIEQEAKRMSTLVNDLFELSKMEEGKFPLQLEWLDVREVLESAAEKTKIKAKEKFLSLELNVEDNIPLILADGTRLEQIFINLIENAIRYTENGLIILRLKCENDQVIINVEDSGSGIPEDDIPYLFERFYRVEKSRSRSLGGTGLGLAIVKNLVELHKGTITIKSTLGVGTTFEITFPTNK